MDKDRIVSRRNVIIAAGTVAAFGALTVTPAGQLIGGSAGVGSDGAAGGTGGSVSLATADFDAWTAAVGALFTIPGAGALRLAGIRPLESGGASRPRSLGRSRAFIALFDPAGGERLAGELIYVARRAGSRAFPIFLSASTDPRTPARMVAVFN